MGSDNVKIQFDGFVPNQKEKSVICEVMRKIEYDSPSDSTIQYKVQKTWTGYLGHCRVASTTGVFTAKKESKTVEELTAAIEKEIYKNLNIWKSNRFKKSEAPLSDVASAS